MSLSHLVRRIRTHLVAVRRKTMFGTARIYEMKWGNRTLRVLDMGGTLQSGTFLGSDDWCEPPFPYLKLYDCAFEARPQAQTLLMLGGGGFAYPKHVVAHWPQARIDVVEIDPAITRIAYDHFLLDRLMHEWHTEATGRLRIYERDALDYLRACALRGRRYDVILNDCFAANVPERSLATLEALRLALACLVPGGLYLVNVISALEGDDAEPLQSLVATMSGIFAHVHALPCGRVPRDERDNVVVIGSERPIRIEGSLVLYEELL